jgi:hypothetical protein
MRKSPWWLRWVIGLVVIAALIGLATHAAIAAVQEPFMVQSQSQESDGWHFALIVVQRDPTSADIEVLIKTFASTHLERPIIAEVYTDGNAATSFEGGGPADTSATAAQHVGEFKRPQSGAGSGWADAKGSQDAAKVTFQAP